MATPADVGVGADVAQGITPAGLKAARRRAFLTQERLAARAGLSVVTW